ncbi:MAG: S-formylglutathione hydrolase [Oceanococcus sp.]
MTEVLTVRSEHRCFGGVMGYYSHPSVATGTAMNFAVFQPPQAATSAVPVLYFLAGLTCNDEIFMIKAGAQRVAAELGIMLVSCDTSPRGLSYPGEDDDWDFGSGAGFYIDALMQPWCQGYQMGRYVSHELPALIDQHFSTLQGQRSIMGHSMGGHGALVTALRNPQDWRSVSAFAPIANPSAVPWGQKAFGHYLGEDQASWSAWDASCLMRAAAHPAPILVDQGMDDAFLERELSLGALEAAAEVSGQALQFRRQPGYDHGYFFIQSFVEDHLRHHARHGFALGA